MHQFIWVLIETRTPRWCSDKESACQCRRHRFNPWVGKIPWRRKWHPTPVFLPGKSHGQRSLAGYSPWGRKESNMTKRQPGNFKNWLDVWWYMLLGIISCFGGIMVIIINDHGIMVIILKSPREILKYLWLKLYACDLF